MKPETSSATEEPQSSYSGPCSCLMTKNCEDELEKPGTAQHAAATTAAALPGGACIGACGGSAYASYASPTAACLPISIGTAVGAGFALFFSAAVAINNAIVRNKSEERQPLTSDTTQKP